MNGIEILIKTPLFCPFCGHANCSIESNASYIWVKCRCCEAQGPKEVDLMAALSSWNFRHNRPSHAEDVS